MRATSDAFGRLVLALALLTVSALPALAGATVAEAALAGTTVAQAAVAAADPRIDFWEGDDGTQDRVCIVPFQDGAEIDFQDDDLSCENDEARSARLFDLSPGNTLTVYDSPDCETDDDWTRIEVLQPIGPEGHLIGWFEGSWNDGIVNVSYSGGNGLAGKVSCVRTQTPDWDEDAIPDVVERFGIRDVNDTQLLNPTALDISPCRKTILVEIDWMEAPGAAGHSHRPSDAAIREATATMAASPVTGPSTCPYAGEAVGDGIELRVLWERGNAIAEQAVYELPVDFDRVMNNASNFHPQLAPYVRYNLWIHQYGANGVGNGSSGLAPAGTDPRSFVVSLGGFAGEVGSQREQSGTFLHELGHTLGLAHGGGDGVNFKPNYLSVMNYRFQTSGLTVVPDLDPPFTVMDYSHQELPQLDSATLSETAGIGAGPIMTQWWDPFEPADPLRTGRGDGPLDWNAQNGIESAAVSVALTGEHCVDPGPNGTLETTRSPRDVLVGTEIHNGSDFTCNTMAAPHPSDDIQRATVNLDQRYLTGWNDWEHVNLRAGAPAAPGEPELTAAQAQAIQEGWDDALLPDVTVPLGAAPPGFSAVTMGVAADDRFVYATHYLQPGGNPPPQSPDPGHLVVLDRGSLQEVARVQVGHAPRSVAVNPATGKIYVVNYGLQSYSVTVVNRDTWDVAATIATGQAPIDVAVNTNLNRAYVSTPYQEKIQVIDGATNTLLAPITIGRGPLGLAVDETTNTLWVARTHRSSQPHVIGLSSVTDRGTGYQIHPMLNLSPEGNQPQDVAVDPINDRVYVANLGGGGVHPNLAVVDRTDRTLISTVPVSGPARSVAVNGFAHRVFVAGEGRVDVVDTGSLKLVRRIPIAIPPGFTWAVAAEQEAGRAIYVGDVRTGHLDRFSFTSGQHVP